MSRHLTLAPFRGKLFNLRGLMCLILLLANTFHLRSAFMLSPAVSCDGYRKKVLNLNQEQTIKGAAAPGKTVTATAAMLTGMGKVYRKPSLFY